MNLLNAFGGLPGAATFALMAAGVLALPLKFAFYENSLLLVFCAFTYLIAANSAAYAFGRPEVAIRLQQGAGYGDRAAVFVRAQVPIITATLGWAALMAISLAALRSARPAAPMPHPLALAGLLALNAGIAAFVAMLGAMIGLNTQSVKGARDLLRMGFTFLLALLALCLFLMPDPWRVPLLRMTRNTLPFSLAAAAGAGIFAAASEFCLRRVLRVLAEKRQGLSIFG